MVWVQRHQCLEYDDWSKICVVGMADKENEVWLYGLNGTENENGWLLKIIFYQHTIRVQIAEIDVGLNGHET